MSVSVFGLFQCGHLVPQDAHDTLATHGMNFTSIVQSANESPLFGTTLLRNFATT